MKKETATRFIGIRITPSEDIEFKHDLSQCNLKPSARTWRRIIRKGLKSMKNDKTILKDKSSFEEKCKKLKTLSEGLDYKQYEYMINQLRLDQTVVLDRMEHEIRD